MTDPTERNEADVAGLVEREARPRGAGYGKFAKGILDDLRRDGKTTAAQWIEEMLDLERYWQKKADTWRGIASAMGYEPKAHKAVKPKSPWLVERIEKYRQQVAEVAAAATLTTYAARIAELEAELAVKDEALRRFGGAAYPVCHTINPRGYNWSEAYLDQAVGYARDNGIVLARNTDEGVDR